MPDALMQWDEKQKRWRAMYKRRRLQVRASVLVAGATTRDATVVAANRWLKEQQAIIDKKLAITTLRPYEAEYLAAIEDIQTTIKALTTTMRVNPATTSMIASQIELFKHKQALLNQALQQEILPPIAGRLRNPLSVSHEQIEQEAVREIEHLIADYHEYPFLRDVIPLDEEQVNDPATTIAVLKEGVVAHIKRGQGFIESEYDRGRITQMLEDANVAVPANLKLEDHINSFLEYQQRRCATNKIGAGRLGKIANTLSRYQQWVVGVTNVEKVGTREHIASYHQSLEDLVIAGTIKPGYANDVFCTFRMFVLWLAKQGTFKEYPHWLLGKGNSKDYNFPVDRQKPMTVPLPLVHQILSAASERLKLCILLTLNCGFGASEIGQLQKEEYDPVEGKITHKRCKTKNSPNVPEVCFLLWDNTKELLDRAIAQCEDGQKCPYLLVNRNGKPLWYEYVADGKSKKYDNISTDFKRLMTKLRKDDPAVPAISYYQFRKTSATLIYNEPQYRIYNELWLAHSPKSVADRHYNNPDRTILDETILWLRGKIFGIEGAGALR